MIYNIYLRGKYYRIRGSVEIIFSNKNIRELCEQEKIAVKKFGTACARKLWLRLQALEAAACVGELVAGRPHPLKGDRAGQFALDLEGARRLVFSAQEPYPEQQDGSVDWPRVAAVCIEYIGDYHD